MAGEEGGGVIHIGLGFWSNNALYSASLSFIMFIFLLTPSDAKDYYYFESNLSLVLLIKVFLTKKSSKHEERTFRHEEITFCHEEITFRHEFIFVFISYFIGEILSQNFVKCGISEEI